MPPFELHQMKILEGIPADDLQPIRKLCEEVFYVSDTDLAFDGEDTKFVYFLRQGQTELIARHPETHHKVVIARKQAGETMGFSSLIHHYQLSFTIHCLEDCHLYRVPRARLLQSLKSSPELFEVLRHRIAKHVFPNLEQALDRIQKSGEKGGWYPHQEDLGSSEPGEGEII
ncbi:MAG: cyclic nucleotide-binding domain-containing protein [bacterium]